MAKRKNQKSKSEGDKKVRVADEEEAARPPIPVSILSGFLGSGKTTLLRYILTSKEHGLKIAVIVNDMAELNVDGQTIARVTKTKREVVTLENGCICCTLRGDLIREINQIQKLQKFDYILIESTGIAEPQQVAESFCVDPETQALAPNPEQMLWNVARLDTCVTVVDVVNFPRYLSSLKRFQDVFQDGLDYAEEGEGEKSISELMVEQVEFANVVLLNKVDLVSEKKIQVTKRLVQTLNPKARVVEGSFGKIDLRYILNTNLFDMQEASESSGWLVSLKEGVNAAQGEADEYGVTSFVYRARKPFHPHRLHSFLKQFFCFAEEWNTADGSDTKGEADDEERMEERYGCILRSKGICWIAGRDEHEMGWAQCGRIIQLSPSSPWYCMAPEEEWEGTESEDDLEAIRAKFSGEYGDRRHEVVFIGTDMKQDAIEDELNKCVLTDEEMKFHSVALPVGTYPDPLLPNLVACEGSQSLFMIVRQDQDQHIRIFPGSCLTLQNLALTIKHEDDEDDIWAVKVWLDKSDSVKQGILLATLRPKSYEQHAMSLSLLPCDEEGGEKATNRRIRVEIIPRKGAKMKPDEWLMVCEVHVMGKVEPLPYSEDPDDEDDEIGDAADSTEDCEMGNCPM